MTLKRPGKRAPRPEEEEAQWPVLESGKSLVDFNMRRKYGNYLDDVALLFYPSSVKWKWKRREKRQFPMRLGMLISWFGRQKAFSLPPLGK